jgi:glucose/arabinose dehydrogenase
MKLVGLMLGLLLVAATATGDQAAFSDFRREHPGVVHKITLADLPAPGATSPAQNPPKVVDRPFDSKLEVLPGYAVTVYSDGLLNPRMIRTAPNGDVFVAQSQPGNIIAFHGDPVPLATDNFATGLNRPFGIAFYPPGPNPTHVYIGNTNSVVRYPYRNGDLKARGPQEVIVAALPSGGAPGSEHWTRDIAFAKDGRKMYVSVGSASNVDEENSPAERERAVIYEFNPDGSGKRIYASGIRNAVGLAIHPQTGQLWASVNERDGLGDNLVPDYVTHVEEGGFYGWPWFYMGGHQDPRHQGKQAELKDKVKTPDVLVQPHSASLAMAFYTGTQFPAEHRDSIFVAQHGSWNKSQRTGYKVIRVPLKNGMPTGEYEDFLTGFVTDDAGVWGRPVAVAVTADGALLVTDDASNSIWRVSYGQVKEH